MRPAFFDFDDLQPGQSALVIAHPGHELRIHHWLERHRPRVYVLTDSAGEFGGSRLSSTTQLLEKVRATVGSIYGRFPDRAIYEMMIRKESPAFVALAEELAIDLISHRIRFVLGDALEGYDPTNDLCRLLIDTAVHLASQSTNLPIANFDFLLHGSPDECPPELKHQAIWQALDGAAFNRKMRAAQNYNEMEFDIDAMLDKFGPDAFCVECLRPSRGFIPFSSTPFYERQGAHQVAAGHYSTVIRYREHFLPIVEAMQRRVERKIVA